MDEQEDFFSKNHGRLFDFAIWSKNIGWIVLVVYVFSALIQTIQIILLKDGESSTGQISQSFLTMLAGDPFHAFRLLVNIAVVLLKGIVYYLVLKGVSLGLNMIVETDINYREQKDAK